VLLKSTKRFMSDQLKRFIPNCILLSEESTHDNIHFINFHVTKGKKGIYDYYRHKYNPKPIVNKGQKGFRLREADSWISTKVKDHYRRVEREGCTLLMHPDGFNIPLTHRALYNIVNKCTIVQGEIQDKCVICFEKEPYQWGYDVSIIPTNCADYIINLAETERITKIRIPDYKLKPGDICIMRNGERVKYIGFLPTALKRTSNSLEHRYCKHHVIMNSIKKVIIRKRFDVVEVKKNIDVISLKEAYKKYMDQHHDFKNVLYRKWILPIYLEESDLNTSVQKLITDVFETTSKTSSSSGYSNYKYIDFNTKGHMNLRYKSHSPLGTTRS